MNIEDRNIIWLDLFYNLSYQKKTKILSVVGNRDVKREFMSNINISSLLTEEEKTTMQKMASDGILDNKLKQFASDNIIPITINDDRYPYVLKEIPSPPFCLYCKGNIQLLNTLCVGVVGTRKVSDYGVICTKNFVKELCKCDVTIVSGLATGVDTVAHKTSLEENGKTIAVLAGGLYNIYPPINKNLAKTMFENNLIICENTPDTPPLSYFFPIRNRIIAGLSRAVVVTEAGGKSGALHTASYAFEFNREVFAIPGKITSPQSEGTNRLIKNLSANIALSPNDIIDFLDLKQKNIEENTAIQLDINEQLVLNYIKTDKRTFQEIAEFSRLSAGELNTILSTLELYGLVVKFPNNSYVGQ